MMRACSPSCRAAPRRRPPGAARRDGRNSGFGGTRRSAQHAVRDRADPQPTCGVPEPGLGARYRDLYTPDSTYHYLCAPNDTHGCLLRASVKNGVAIYSDASFGYDKATDIYGNKASHRWNPRACVSGLAYIPARLQRPPGQGRRRARRIRGWVDDGMPREADGQPPLEYRTGRGKGGLRPGHPRGGGERSPQRSTSTSPPPTAAKRAPNSSRHRATTSPR